MIGVHGMFGSHLFDFDGCTVQCSCGWKSVPRALWTPDIDSWAVWLIHMEDVFS